MMKRYWVRMYCRRQGAIGSFYVTGFYVLAPDDADRGTIFDAWQKAHSELWEPHHIESFQEAPPPAPVPTDDIGEYDTDAH